VKREEVPESLVAASFLDQGLAVRQLSTESVCCCMERECSEKGDATRVQITAGGTTYCCKPRSPSMWSQENGCDKRKYTLALTDVATDDVIVPDPAICAVETTTTTTTTTIEETTTEETTAEVAKVGVKCGLVAHAKFVLDGISLSG